MSTISDPLLTGQILDRFSTLLVERNIPALVEVAEEISTIIDLINPSTPNGARLVGRLAVAADLGCLHPSVLQRLLVKFPKAVQGDLRGSEIVCVRLAFGISRFLNGDTEPALK